MTVDIASDQRRYIGQEATRCVCCGHRRIFHYRVDENPNDRRLRSVETPVGCSLRGCGCDGYHLTVPAALAASS